MKNPIKSLVIVYGVYVAIFLVAAAAVGATSGPMLDSISSSMKAADQPTAAPVPQPEAMPEPVQQAPSAPQKQETISTPPTANNPAPAQPEAVTPPKDGGHIPFTNEPVQPGVPESYVDTVGQCPFYEMAGPKGCLPPPDIECNSDWTICKYLGK